MSEAPAMQKQRGKNTTGLDAYLDKDNPTDSFQNQHDSHRERIDAGIVAHVRVIFHAVVHNSLISQHLGGVLCEIQNPDYMVV